MPKNSDYKYVGNTTKPGNPLWDEYVNVKTGESTLQEHTPRRISSFDTCEHYWNVSDANGNIQCKRCDLGKRIAWGHEIVKDGKIIKLKNK